MRSRNVLLASALALVACKSHNGGITIGDMAGVVDTDMDPNGSTDMAGMLPNSDFASGDMAHTFVTGVNTTPLVVDTGPSNSQFASYNAAFVSLKICAPGTTTCQTIDHIAIDTGSVGMRIQASVLNSTILNALSPIVVGGKSVAECYTYADGYTWGSVRTADVTMGGETAGNMAFHIIGDSETSIPQACKSGGQGHGEDTVDEFGYNGIIGISAYGPDCGTACATNKFGQYYTCTGTTCAEATMSVANQVKNPIFEFPQDNNGVIIDLPDPGDDPAATQTGSLIFGINTQTNNQMGSGVNIYPEGSGGQGFENYNNLPGITIDGKTSQQSLVDSGTTDLLFDDSSLTKCTGQDQGRYCPASKTAVPISMMDGDGNSHQYSVNVQSADTLFSESSQDDCAFKDIADYNDGSGQFTILGLPFFYGRKVYVGFDGQAITGLTPPFEAF